MGDQIGDQLLEGGAEAVLKPLSGAATLALKNSANFSPMVAGITGGTTLAALAGLGTLGYNKLTNPERKGKSQSATEYIKSYFKPSKREDPAKTENRSRLFRNIALTGAAGFAGNAMLADHIRTVRFNSLLENLNKTELKKVSNVLSQPLDTEILNSIRRDMSLNYSQKRELSSLVSNLSPHETTELSSVLKSTIGGGVGYIVAKYLLDLGITGKIILSLIGAVTGSLFGQNKVDSYTGSLYGLNRKIY